MRALSFFFGATAGVYIDQNYNLPKVTTFVNYGIEWVRKTEESLRKNTGR